MASAVGLVLLTIGAVTFHVRAKDGAKIYSSPAVLGLLALVELILRAVSA